MTQFDSFLEKVETLKSGLGEYFNFTISWEGAIVKISILCIKPICNKTPRPLQAILHKEAKEEVIQYYWGRVLHYILYEEL